MSNTSASPTDKLSTMTQNQRIIAENQEKVYNAGCEKGKAEGAQSEYDAFWDVFQDYGKRTHYVYGFAGHGWRKAILNPKYPLNNVTNAASMFSNGQRLDKIPAEAQLDLSNSSDCSYLFNSCISLTDIEYIKFNNKIEQSKNNYMFASCTRLKNITIDGTIEFSISFSASPLTKESIKKVFAALSEDVTGKTVTFKGSAVDAAFKTPDSDTNNGRESEEWKALVATRQQTDENGNVVSGWNIGFV